MLRPGDTCIIHGGVYRETMVVPCSGEAGRPIRIQAAPGARAALSATRSKSREFASLARF